VTRNRLRWWQPPIVMAVGAVGGYYLGGVVAVALPLGIELGDPLNPKGPIIVDGFLQGGLLLAVLVSALLISRMTPAELGLCRPDLSDLGAPGWAAAAVALAGVALVSANSLSAPAQVTVLGFGVSLTLVAFCFVFAFLGPLAEEVAFRGYLYPGVRSMLPVAAAVVISGLIFGAALAYRGYPLSLLAVLAGLGICWNVLRERTDSIVPGLVLHGAMNALVLVGLTAQPGVSLATFAALLAACGLACLVRPPA
jgi:membrane protease YdiL (CAAX protease family)